MCDEFFVTVLEIFDRVKSVALWSAKKRTIKGYGSAAIVEDASKLRSAIVMASRKHTTAKPYSRGGRVFNARSFFRGFDQSHGQRFDDVSQQSAYPLTMDCASTVKDQDISLNIAHSSHVQSVVQNHRQPARHSHNISLSEKDKYNVEHENYEYEGETLIVKNRLKDHVKFWKNVLSPPELVLSTVKFGYVIPFFQDPIQFA